jgi:hypothetical protein
MRSNQCVVGINSCPCFPALLLILTTRDHLSSLLEYALQVLIYSECNGLSRSNAHHAGCDALPETLDTLLFPHVTAEKVSRVSYTCSVTTLPCDRLDSGHCAHPCLCRCLLQSCLNRVNRSVGEGSHGTRDETNTRRLPSGQVCGALILL